MIWSDASRLLPWALLLLRVVVGIVFVTSGWSHARKPRERSKSIEMPAWFTAVLGWTETLAGVALICGLYPQVAAALLFAVMLGALGMKVFRWRKGFFEEEGFGWHYDLLLAAACLVFISASGGALSWPESSFG